MLTVAQLREYFLIIDTLKLKGGRSTQLAVEAEAQWVHIYTMTHGEFEAWKATVRMDDPPSLS